VKPLAHHRAAIACLFITPFLIASCANNTPASSLFGLKNEPVATAATVATTAPQRFAGRISLVFDETAPGSPASFFGSFELRGQLHRGELDLLTPLGSVAAQLQWQPHQALLIQGGQTRSFASANELIAQATGTAISAQQLFDWLQGQSNTTSTSDWQVDLTRYADGRITAKRSGPPSATLRIILDQP
jgi:outer membrane lipoprotein LolB